MRSTNSIDISKYITSRTWLPLFIPFIFCLGAIGAAAQKNHNEMQDIAPIELIKPIERVAIEADYPRVVLNSIGTPETQPHISKFVTPDSLLMLSNVILAKPTTTSHPSAVPGLLDHSMQIVDSADRRALNQRRGRRSAAPGDMDNDGIPDSLDLCPDHMDTALDFDGIDDFVTVPHDPALNVGTGDFTFEAWLHPASNQYITILAKGFSSSSGTNYKFDITPVTSSTYNIRLFYANDFYVNTTPISLNEWNHVAVTFNFTTKQAVFYLNGVADGTGTYSQAPHTTGTESLYIGRASTSCCNSHEGRMDDVSIWNTVRTASEIAEDMTSVDLFAPGLVMSFDMNESPACVDNTSTTSLLDQSQNNFVGQLNNFSLLPGCTSNWSSGRNLDSDQNGLGDGCDYVCSAVLYVDSSATGGNNLGTSWADAYVSLSQALIHADFCPDIDSIHVAAGTYIPYTGGLGNARTASFVIPDSVQILGQFPSGGGDLSTRESIHQTTLSGDIGIVGNNLDNVYHVVVAQNISSQSSVDGFTITNGRADGGGNDNHGAGWFNMNASPGISNCNFIDNHAIGDGGGLYNVGDSISLLNCQFMSNTAGTGGGGIWSWSSLSLFDCHFIMNTTNTSYGGGVGLAGRLTANNVTYISNSSNDFAGGLYSQYDYVSLVDCQFISNMASNTGGGVGLISSSLHAENSTFTSNSSSSGGGLYSQNDSVVLMDCQFISNMASNTGGGVGLISSSLHAENSTFTSNSSNNGGGLDVSGSSVSLQECQFNANTATNHGGGVRLLSSPLYAQNLLFAGNSSNTAGGGLYSQNDTVVLSDCQFSMNTAANSGGGACFMTAPMSAQNVSFTNNSATDGGGLYSQTASVSLLECVFNSNMATICGGGVRLADASITAQNVMFTNNSALVGGGLESQNGSISLMECQFKSNTATSFGGGVYHYNLTEAQVKNCRFIFNESDDGNGHGSGGAYQVAGTGRTDFVNCLFTGNQALGASALGGGAILVISGDIDVTNSTIVNNHSALHGGAISIFDATGSASLTNSILWNNVASTDSIIYNGNGGSASMNYSLFDANNCLPNVSCGSGMIYNQDPLFIFSPSVPTLAGDLRVKTSSPAINAGINDSIPPECTTDLNGLYRFFDGIVDIGAYEFGDSDADGIPNNIDLCPDDMDTALDFDGTDDHIVVPHDPALNFAGDDFTFQAWVYPTGQGWSTILSKGTGIFGTSSYYFSINPSMLLALSLENQTHYSTTAIPLYQWSHVAVSFEFSTEQATFYLNGIADGQGSFPNPPPSDLNPMFIGQQGYDCACNRFQGRLDDVTIWKTMRTPSELALDMAAGVDAAQAGLVVSYNMNETAACIDNTSTTMITDQSPNGFDGALTNFSLLPGCASNWTSGRNLDSDQDGLGDGCDYRCNTGLTVLYVDSSAIGGKNLGASWTDAYLSLSAALRHAKQCSDIDSIFVAAGTYVPDFGGLTNLRKTSFIIPEGVQILGQFPMGGGTLSQRDSLHETILSGDIGIIGDTLNNAFHVVYSTNITSASSVDGFIITNGNANGGGDDNHGAGWFNMNASPAISNCKFIDNHAIGDGGGLYNIGDSISLLGCQFISNTAAVAGGGIWSWSSLSLMNCQFIMNTTTNSYGGGVGLAGRLTANNVTFTSNSSNGLGGGLYCENYDVSLVDCQFISNMASIDGGGTCLLQCPLVAQNVSFVSNSANNTGGGLYSQNDSVVLMDCQFSDNIATVGGGGINLPSSSLHAENSTFTSNSSNSGGGISSQNNSVVLMDCQFSDNTATGSGGGVKLTSSSLHAENSTFTSNSSNSGGGVHVIHPGSSQVKDCIFKFNQAHNGSSLGAGGAYHVGGSGQTEFFNCLFEANQALGSSDNGGGAIIIDGGFVNLINSTIVNNHSATHGGAITLRDNTSFVTLTNDIFWNNSATTDSTIYNGNGGSVFANYCLFDALNCLPNVSCGIGVIYDLDPQFVDMISIPPLGGNFNLRYGSPTINAGINASIPAGDTTDLIGSNRIINTTVDMGAYEFNYEFPCGVYGNLVIDDVPVFTGEYKASGLISSEGIINTSSNGPVSFKSESEIELNQGFEVKLGEIFNAVIEDPCVD